VSVCLQTGALATIYDPICRKDLDKAVIEDRRDGVNPGKGDTYHE